MSLPARYEYKALIGEGYFSQVQSYIDRDTNTPVAIKRLHQKFVDHPEYVRRFAKEVSLLRTLAPHPNVVTLLHEGLDGDQPYYVMPAARCNLHKHISRNNSSLSLEDRVGLMDQVLAAVVHAHEREILHRDICPWNVLLYGTQSAPDVKVSDFGLGKDLTAISHSTRSSALGYGHVYYVAPEQHSRLKDADARSDVYALGKLLNFVLTGRVPDVFHPCDFGTVIRRATAREPENRFQSAAEFLDAYDRTKRLVLGSVPVKKQTVADFDEGDDIDWLEFHELALTGGYGGHVWSGYIDPIITLLSRDSNLEKYYEEVKGAIVEFLAVFRKRLSECYGSVGWPFSATDGFGSFLGDVYRLVNEEEAKLHCIEEIWDIAYIHDQWAVQRIAKSLLSTVPKTIEADLANYIADIGRCCVGLDHFGQLGLSKALRNAIVQVTGAAVAKESE